MIYDRCKIIFLWSHVSVSDDVAAEYVSVCVNYNMAADAAPVLFWQVLGTLQKKTVLQVENSVTLQL